MGRCWDACWVPILLFLREIGYDERRITRHCVSKILGSRHERYVLLT